MDPNLYKQGRKCGPKSIKTSFNVCAINSVEIPWKKVGNNLGPPFLGHRFKPVVIVKHREGKHQKSGSTSDQKFGSNLGAIWGAIWGTIWGAIWGAIWGTIGERFGERVELGPIWARFWERFDDHYYTTTASTTWHV